ncbi:MAG: glycogen synthase, partial [Paracoccaceae bacterium]
MASSAVIRALSVTSECAPLVKTGGLADVAGALPAALAGQGVQMRTLLPGYPAVLATLGTSQQAASFDDLFGGPAQVLATQAAGLDLLVLDAPHLFDRTGSLYLGPDGADWPDNAERFAALSWVGAWIAANGLDGWTPDVLHGHDWQAGLAPEYLRMMGASDRVATVLTIHNIAFHGLTGADGVDRLGLEPWRFNAEGYEFWGQVSALKAGLMASDYLTTVSETYAAELMTPDFGMGLDGVLRSRADSLLGILNGIDETAWDPRTDPAITPYKSLRGKAKAKAALQAEFGLDPAAGPLCVVVSRLTDQKGLDLLLEALPVLAAREAQLVLLGSGDAGL